MKRGLCLTLAVLTLLLCTACGPSRTASDSEEARDAAREEPAAVVPALTRSLPVAEALQRGAVQSIWSSATAFPTATPTTAASGDRMSVKRWGAG